MISNDKKTARKLAAERRRVAFEATDAVHAANRSLQELVAQIDGPVAGYLPIRTEMDPLPAMMAIERPVGVPVIVAVAQPLIFAKWTESSHLVAGAFGVKIPEPVIPVTPAILIVPLLAFDRDGYRLGYGGGFYDRTIEQLGPNITAIGFAYAAQECPAVPRDSTDQRLDFIVTENEILSLG